MNFVSATLVLCALCITLSSARPQRWSFPSSIELDPLGFNDMSNNNNLITFATTSQPAVSSSTVTAPVTALSEQFLECMQRCPATSEYNPVCGTDNKDYHNIARLECAKRCGANVAAVRMGTCFPLWKKA